MILRSLIGTNGGLIAIGTAILAMWLYHKATVYVAFERGETSGASQQVAKQERADNAAKSTARRVRARTQQPASGGVLDPYAVE